MLCSAVMGGHAAHFVVFGVPIAILVGTVGWQEMRALRPKGSESGTDLLSDGRLTDGLWVAVAGLVLAGAVHAAVIPEHLHHYLLFGVFFAGLSVVELWLAVVLIRRPERRLVGFVAIGSALTIVLWLMSRTTGIPIGPEQWTPEPFGALDIAASGAELVTAVGCVAHLWMVSDHRRFSMRRLPGLTR
jgi:hypothetical protein